MPLTLRSCPPRTNWHSAGYYGLMGFAAFFDGYAKGLAKRGDPNAPKFRLIADLAQTSRDVGTAVINSTLCPSAQFPQPSIARVDRTLLTASDFGLVRVG